MESERVVAYNDFITQAIDAGVPQDQLRNFLKAGYTPLPWQLHLHAACREADKDNGPVDIGAGGARGPGKSHGIFAQVTLDDCQRLPRLKCLFLRQTGKSAEESFQDLVDSVLLGRTRYYYNTSKGTLRFANGSKVILGGFEHEGDIDKYIGIQYDVIAIEERNQLTGEKIIKLKGSLRTTKPDWRARMYSSFNPGNIGHNDVKKTFVIPKRKGNEKETRFIPSTYKDNFYLKKEYIEYLHSIGGTLGRAWREGDFDVFEGQYFNEWRHEKHVIEPFAIPTHFKRYRAYDHGRTKPASCGWWFIDTDGNVFKYRELYGAGKNVDELAYDITRLSHDAGCQIVIELNNLAKSVDANKQKEITDQIKRGAIRCSGLGNCERYEYSVADPSIFANMGFVDKFGGQTIAETYARYGIQWIPASNRRVDGWNLMHMYLGWKEGKEPRMRYFKTCIDSIRTIPDLIHDEHRPEDIDSDGEDHAADEARYFLASIHEQQSSKPKSEIERKFEEMKRIESPVNFGVYLPQ